MPVPASHELLASILFGLAVVHTFLCGRLLHAAHRFPPNSIPSNLLHLLGEVEVVFGFWAGLLMLLLCAIQGTEKAIATIESCDFTEPIFVFAIMTMAATEPVISCARRMILGLSRILPLTGEWSFFVPVLVLGPLLGSFITEPAAMTVTALILKERYYQRELSEQFKYLVLAVLFVNVSIGGALTTFAAPPVLMVAHAWDWNGWFMLRMFGWKVVLAVILNTLLAGAILRKELRTRFTSDEPSGEQPSIWITGIHMLMLGLVVVFAHHPVIFMGLFLYFIGLVSITRKWHTGLALRQSLLVGFFLAGLVVLGKFQHWWLSPLLRSLNETTLFLGATGLTAVTDNAALTYLGSQVQGVSDTFKYALVAGAIAGGGMTVIANAPNPAGYAILQSKFGEDGISPLKLALAALVPTLIAMACLWVLPDLGK